MRPDMSVDAALDALDGLLGSGRPGMSALDAGEGIP